MSGGVSRVRVLVTRPADQAPAWVEGLNLRGFAAEALPLLAIAPAADHAALSAMRERLGTFAAVMFVSAAAVQQFFEKNDANPSVKWSDDALNTRAWATGPGTVRALLAVGWPASRIDAPSSDAAQFDSEALWARVQPAVTEGTRVLIVRGGDAHGRAQGRDWLATQLAAAGAQVQTLVAYRRSPAELDAAGRARASRAASDGSVWLFSSSEAIASLLQQLPLQGWQAARAVCTHARIAEAAQRAGFGVVRASRPELDAVAASIESVR
jgi:uroporphyrinogen-III synthase